MPAFKDKCLICGKEFVNYTNEGYRFYACLPCQFDYYFEYKYTGIFSTKKQPYEY